MPASITSTLAIFTIRRARLPTVTLAARSSLAAIGMKSLHGIFLLTVAVPNAAPAVPVCLKQTQAAGVLAVSRSGYEDLNPDYRQIEIQGEETCPIKE